MRFVLSEMFSGIRRNLSMAVSVVLVTFVSLTFVGAALLLQAQIGYMKGEWYDKVQVSIVLCPKNSKVTNCASGEATEAQIDQLAADLDSPEMQPYVEDVVFESKEEAFANFEKRFAGTQAFEGVTVDDMQAAFRVKLYDPQKYEILAEVFTGKPGVEEVFDQRDVLEPLFNVLRIFTYGSLAVAGVMLVAAVLLITTTIRLSAMSRRRETEIMRLVGSSNLFIQLPFMLEGAVAAGVGALMATGTLWLGVRYVVGDALASTIGSDIAVVTTTDVWHIAPLLVLVAVLLAIVSSLVTLSRYTKV